MAITNQGNGQRPSASSQSRSLKNGPRPEYSVQINVTGDSKIAELNAGVFPIVAALPERWHMNFSSNWQSPFGKNYLGDAASNALANKTGMSQGAASEVVSGASAVAGIPTRFKHQSAQVWESTSAMSFSLDLIFHAKENSEKEVKAKHKALLQLTAPSELGPLLVQPGPIILEQTISPNSRNISLQIGKYLFLDNVIITGVSSDVVTLCDVNGIPISMNINIEVQSFYACFTVEDIEKMFKGA